MILEKLGGIDVEITVLEQWVITDTTFLPQHLRKPILEPMETTTPALSSRRNPDEDGTHYPPGTILRF